MRTITAIVLCGLLASPAFGRISLALGLPKELRNLNASQLDALDRLIAYKIDTAKALIAFNVRTVDALSDDQRQLVIRIINYSDTDVVSNEELDSLIEQVLNLRERGTRIVNKKQYLAFKSVDYDADIISIFDKDYYRVRIHAPDDVVNLITSLTDEQLDLIVGMAKDRDNPSGLLNLLSPPQSSEQSTVKN